MQLIILSLCTLLVHQTVRGMHFPFGRINDFRADSLKPQIVSKLDGVLLSSNESSEIFNTSVYGTQDDKIEYPQVTGDTILRTEENNSTLSRSNNSLTPAYSTSADTNTSDVHDMETLTTFFNNESHSQSSKEFSSSESSAAKSEGTTSGIKSDLLTTPSNNKTNATTKTTTDDDEPEGVARGKPSTTESVNTTTTQHQTLYERTLTLIGDPYVLSILIPIVAGVVFATTIIITIATCRCIRRRCIRRRLRRKKLPDSVKNLRPSDRARLLAESSDEEF